MNKVLLSFLVVLSISSFAQKKEQQEILKVVGNVFEAMRTNDSTLLKQCFTTKPNTFTVLKDQAGRTNLIEGNFSKFVSAVGTPKEDVWNEPIWNEKVEIDGDLASVWVDYAFYRNDTFSHCGVDAFHLVKLNNQWKIFHLVDTRRKERCEIPENIKP